MRKILSFFANRIVFFLIPFLLQFAIVVAFVFILEEYIYIMYGVMVVLALILVIYVVSNDDNPAYKIGWIVIILLVPLFGAFVYLLYGDKRIPEVRKRRTAQIEEMTKDWLYVEDNLISEIEKQDKISGGQAKYIAREGFSAHKNTDVKFLNSGQEKWASLLEDLERAEHHIFLQYFIIREGEMWQSILNVLERKVEEGVDVRVLFDDVGCISTLPSRYDRELIKRGIKCHIVNPLRMYRNFTFIQNNRDHRKMFIIDGHIGYVGGINLGDEYVNLTSPYGKWKDCAIRIEGLAVWSLTVSFLKTWMMYDSDTINHDQYRPENFMEKEKRRRGYVIPYQDSPLDYNNVGENVYFNMINSATEELFIASPYLIPPNELITALALAARKGVDVRIITPNVPDKKNVFLLTQSYYKNLLAAGVKVYQYTPGFIHSKTFVADGKLAVCGTVNLDFRSLYLHFENAVWMYKCDAVKEMRQDYLASLEECKEITLDEVKAWPWIKKAWQGVLRIFAPLF